MGHRFGPLSWDQLLLSWARITGKSDYFLIKLSFENIHAEMRKVGAIPTFPHKD